MDNLGRPYLKGENEKRARERTQGQCACLACLRAYVQSPGLERKKDEKNQRGKRKESSKEGRGWEMTYIKYFHSNSDFY